MIVGIKVNSYEYDSECVSSIIHEDISEVHLFYESIEYKNTLVSIIEKNVIDMNIRVYIHINNIDDINLDDVLLFNRHECIVVLDYVEDWFLAFRYNPMIIAKIDRLMINFHGCGSLSEIIDCYDKAIVFYSLRNAYTFNLDIDINILKNIEDDIKTFRQQIVSECIAMLYFRYNILEQFKILHKNDDILYLLPYTKFYYDLKENVIKADNISFEPKNLSSIYKEVFSIKEECSTCVGTNFCPKYNVNCENCKKFYSFFENYILHCSKEVEYELLHK